MVPPPKDLTGESMNEDVNHKAAGGEKLGPDFKNLPDVTEEQDRGGYPIDKTRGATHHKKKRIRETGGNTRQGRNTRKISRGRNTPPRYQRRV